jgi:2-methylaconitate cis-trans-isomerase PrpF
MIKLRCVIMRGETSKAVFLSARRIMEGYVYLKP